MERKPLLLGGVLTSVGLIFSSCGEDTPPPVGDIFDKEFQSERIWELPDEKEAHDDEDYILRINYCGEGNTEECRIVQVFVDRDLFEKTRIGEYVNLRAENTTTEDPIQILPK